MAAPNAFPSQQFLFWSFVQICNFILTQPNKADLTRPQSPLELLYSQPTTSSHKIFPYHRYYMNWQDGPENSVYYTTVGKRFKRTFFTFGVGENVYTGTKMLAECENAKISL